MSQVSRRFAPPKRVNRQGAKNAKGDTGEHLVEEDFFALLTGRYVKIRSQRGLADVYELLGRGAAGEYVHVAYRVLDDGGLRVFHLRRMSDHERRRFRRMRQ